jgi:hypothetical protein
VGVVHCCLATVVEVYSKRKRWLRSYENGELNACMADGGDAPADTVDLLQASDPRLLKHTLHYISYAL